MCKWRRVTLQQMMKKICYIRNFLSRTFCSLCFQFRTRRRLPFQFLHRPWLLLLLSHYRVHSVSTRLPADFLLFYYLLSLHATQPARLHDSAYWVLEWNHACQPDFFATHPTSTVSVLPLSVHRRKPVLLPVAMLLLTTSHGRSSRALRWAADQVCRRWDFHSVGCAFRRGSMLLILYSRISYFAKFLHGEWVSSFLTAHQQNKAIQWNSR